MTGWVSLHRNITEWEWYDDINTCRLFIHCLIRANHEPSKWRGIDIDRGQFISSLSKLSKETSLSIKQVRTSLSKLNKTGEVASEGHAQHTVFTVKNYDKYQVTGKQNGKPRASDGQAKGKRGATDNNDNNEKNEKENKFIEFWSTYKKSADKAKCHDKFVKLPMDDIDEILNVVGDYVKSTPDVKFRKNPLTWINGRCWEDEIQQQQAQESFEKPEWMRGIK